MTGYATATPRIAVYLIIRNGDTCAFVRRANTGWRDGFYGLPAGKVEKDESFTAAAIREAKEEVGITIRVDQLRQVLTSHRTEDGSDWVDVMFEVMAYEGDVYNAEPHMHSELAWLSLGGLPDDVTPSQKEMLSAYAHDQPFVEIGWN